MKKVILCYLMFWVLQNIHAQTTVMGNVRPPGTPYLGWDGTGIFPGSLEIRNNFNQPIDFYTNNSATPRMRIASAGWVGVGSSNPSSVLHLNKANTGEMFRTVGADTSENRWRLFTNGNAVVEKFRLFVPKDTTNVFLQAQRATGNLSFNTAGGSNTNFPDTKLRIFPDDIDRIVAFENPNPLSFVPAYNAKFIINDRNATSSSATLVDDALLLRVQGIGKLLPGRPIGLPAGASMGNFTMAEIISTRKNVGDAGLRLQGSRTNCNACDIGFIDFANYDDIPPSSEILFNMARLASGSQARDSSRGFIRFYTNDGTGNPLNANDAGLLERMRINGFGDGFFNLVPVNGQANMMNVTARFNILDNDRAQLRLINFANNQNIAKIYTNLQTTDDGDLFLQPLDETQPEDSLYARFVGIHNPQPQNTLDIQSTKASPRWNELSTYGTSGLRFSNLSAINSPMANLGKGVLAVDSNGNVVYVNAQSGFATCEDSINGVLNVYSKLDLNNYNFYFTNNDSLGTNHVGIGYDCGDNLPGKLSTIQTHPSVISVAGTKTFAGHFRNIDASNSFKTIFTGVYGEAIGQNMLDGAINFGGYFKADSARQSVGAAGISTGGAYSVGVYGEAMNGTVVNYGVYGKATGTNAWAGWFDGPGFLGAGAWTYSDYNLKQNIQEFSEANSILSQLNPVRYDFKTTEFPQLNLSATPQIGLIAQELQQVLPDAVRDAQTPAKYDSLGNIIEESVAFKAVSYEKLIPVLVGGHQEQQSTIEQLQTENEDLKAKLNELNAKFNQLEICLMNRFPDLCTMSQGIIQQNSTGTQEQNKSSINVKLSNKNTIVLNQNVPNPFAESTVINYSIPATVVKAQIHFYDGKGKLINSVEITTRGAGQLNVFGEDLSSGTYTYTLVADGQIVSTKKMVKE